MEIHFKNQQQQPRLIDLRQVQIMGILNFTPDSFSDSGKFFSLDKALVQVEKMLNDGAYIIDIGGESTRPNAPIVSEVEELDRVIPLIEAVRQRFDCLISVDSSKPAVFREAARAGVDMLNDIRALTEPQALETAAELALPVCLMHMQGTPQTMQQAPHYDDLLDDVADFLNQRIFALLKHLNAFVASGFPVLAGLSRKSMIGAVTHQPVEKRLVGSVAGALLAAQNGAKILRVHDVEATADALKVWQAMQAA